MKIPSVEAVEYGREVLEREVERLRRFEAKAAERGDVEAAERWGRLRKWLSWQVLGGSEGCVITAFDARWLDESFRRTMGDALERAAYLTAQDGIERCEGDGEAHCTCTVSSNLST